MWHETPLVLWLLWNEQHQHQKQKQQQHQQHQQQQQQQQQQHSGSAASSVKDSMVSKVTGSGQGANDSGFKAGNNGLLQTGNGQSFSLSGSGVKEQVTQKVCGMVLDHAKSLL